MRAEPLPWGTAISDAHGPEGRPSYQEVVAERDALAAQVEQLRARIAELERLVEEVRRQGKRQAAPFSKGKQPPSGKRPGRRSGKDYGTRGGRAVPERVDEDIDVPLPEACPEEGCDGTVVEDRVADQYQEDLP